MKLNWFVIFATVFCCFTNGKDLIAQAKPLSIHFTAPTQMYQGASFKLKVQVKHQIKKLVQQFGVVEATIETELAGSECYDPEHA